MLEYGLNVTVNTDNMTVSGTNMALEYDLLRDKLGMTEQQERQLTENSIRAAFLSEEEKTQLFKRIFE